MTITACIGRYHDGTAKPNWGGRATSPALARIARSNGRSIASVVNGDLIVAGIGVGDLSFSTRMTNALDRRAGGRLGLRDRNLGQLEARFDHLEETAASLLASPQKPERLQSVLRSLEAADEFWMNGEGDLILSPRMTLYRTLLIMWLASLMDVEVKLVNSILSDPVASDRSPAVTRAVGRTLEICDQIIYRDPQSLALHETLYPTVVARWLPDALFAWTPDIRSLAAPQPGTAAFGPRSERLAPEVQHLLHEEAPFVAVSGSSVLNTVDAEGVEARLTSLLTQLTARGLTPVVVATCTGDRWMLPVAQRSGVPSVAPEVPLVAGITVLGRASCFLSGRYHPSILAAANGTPLVTMASNSHKTLSLHAVLGDEHPREAPFLGDPSSIAALVDSVEDAVATAASSRPKQQASVDRLRQRLDHQYLEGGAAETTGSPG